MERYSIRTSTVKDSAGKAFGLEIAHFLPVFLALLLSMVLFFAVSMAEITKDLSVLAKIGIGATPLVLSIIYVVFFLMGKPPHFQDDFLDTLLYGKDAGVFPRKKKKFQKKGLK